MRNRMSGSRHPRRAALGGILLSAALLTAGAIPGRTAAKPAKGAKAAAGGVANGKKLYAAQRCDMCHKIGSSGTTVGPDLTDEGKKRDRAWMFAFLKNPRSKVPKGTMPPARGSDKEIGDLAAYMLSLK
jgi:mono/diheme cytochrome c family protein